MPVRLPTPHDAPAIARAHVRAWQVAYAGIMPATYLDGLMVADSEARWERWLADSGHQILVTESKGAVAGFCFFGESRDEGARSDTGEIRAINLDPDFWRHGLGGELLTASLAELRKLGFCDVTLWVLTANGRARAFYEAHGWYADGGVKHEGPPGCEPLEHVRYRVEAIG